MTSFIKVTIINHIQVWNTRRGLSSLICLLLMRDSYPCLHLEYRLVSWRYEILLFKKSSRYRTLVWQANGTTKFQGGSVSFLPFPFRNSETVFRGMYHTLFSNAFNSKTDVNTSAQQSRLFM